MRINQTYYGDFDVVDEMPFATADIVRALHLILKQYRVRAFNWPVDTDYNDKTGYWHLRFTRPVSDEEYVAFMEPHQQVAEGLSYIEDTYGNA